MAVFTEFNYRLPDPTFNVSESGAVDATGVSGPGFASIRFSGVKENSVSRARSGSGIINDSSFHMWKFSIDYNPLLRSQFEIVSVFLDQCRLENKPFYVVLPQYSNSRDSEFATWLNSNNPTIYGASDIDPGETYFTIRTAAGKKPKIGDFLKFDDANDVTHHKMYKINRVETQTDYNSNLGLVGDGSGNNEFRIHVSPPIRKLVDNSAIIIMKDPTFRVTQKGDTQEYSLDTENQYKFQIECEEFLI